MRTSLEDVSVSLKETVVDVRGIKVKMLEGGSGTPVLFLHGSNGVTRAMMPFLESLASRNKLLAPVHPGFHGSDNPDLIRNVPDMAMFYLEFMETLGLEKLHLAGNSLGGWIAAEIAVRDRSRIKTLTLICPAGIRVPGISLGDLFLWTQAETVRNLYFDQALAEKLLATPLSEDQVDIQLHNRFAAVKLQWEPRGFNPDLEKWLHRIRLPAHVIWGEADRIVPYAYAQAWLRELPDSALTPLADIGHLPHVESAAQTLAHMQEFWQRAA
jgi:pimeloyl-ACP methyl ester carboxylesterase